MSQDTMVAYVSFAAAACAFVFYPDESLRTDDVSNFQQSSAEFAVSDPACAPPERAGPVYAHAMFSPPEKMAGNNGHEKASLRKAVLDGCPQSAARHPTTRAIGLPP